MHSLSHNCSRKWALERLHRQSRLKERGLKSSPHSLIVCSLTKSMLGCISGARANYWDAQTRAAEVKADAIARQRADDEASSKALVGNGVHEALNQEIASQRVSGAHRRRLTPRLRACPRISAVRRSCRARRWS